MQISHRKWHIIWSLLKWFDIFSKLYHTFFSCERLPKTKYERSKVGRTASSNPRHSTENTKNVCHKQPTTPEQSCLDWQTTATATMTTPLPKAKFKKRKGKTFAGKLKLFIFIFSYFSRCEAILSLRSQQPSGLHVCECLWARPN